jgi:hypothetical protein
VAAVIVKAPSGSQAVLANNAGYNAVVAQDQDVRIVTSSDDGDTFKIWNFGTDGSTTIPAPGAVTFGPIASTVGTGVGGTFHVTIANGEYDVTADDNGTGYGGVTDPMTVPGDQLGGVTPDNDLTVTFRNTKNGGWFDAVENFSGIPAEINWKFNTNNTLTFPDTTVQTTAWRNQLSSDLSVNNHKIFGGNGGTVGIRTQSYFNGSGLDPIDYDWTFGADGSLTLPSGTTLTDDSGRPEFTSVNTFKITTDSTTNFMGPYTWTFSENTGEGLILPDGSNIYNGYTRNNLAIRTVLDSSFSIVTRTDLDTNAWRFDLDGTLTFPDDTVQTTAYQQVAVPVTSKGVSGDTAGRIAFDSDYIYYCTASYDGDNNIWKRVALSTDTWDNTPPPPVTYSLTVTTAGDGNGTVTSSPAGISSPTLTATFAENTSVTLSANAQIGSTFAGWSGAAYGTAPAQITMDGDKTVTATFDLNSPPPPPTPTLVSIDITPRDYTIDIYLETSLQLTAIGTYSDSSTENLTATVEWASTNTNFATFSGSTPGLLEVTVGYNPATDGTTTTVTSTLGGIQGTAYEYGTDSTPPPPPPPPPPPTPSYNYSVDNVTPSLGTPVTVTITTTDVEDGTTLYWQLTEIQAPSGFDTDTSGYITISGNTAAVTITMTDDGGLGNHTVTTLMWNFRLYSDSGYLDQLLVFGVNGVDPYV